MKNMKLRARPPINWAALETAGKPWLLALVICAEQILLTGKKIVAVHKLLVAALPKPEPPPSAPTQPANAKHTPEFMYTMGVKHGWAGINQPAISDPEYQRGRHVGRAARQEEEAHVAPDVSRETGAEYIPQDELHGYFDGEDETPGPKAQGWADGSQAKPRKYNNTSQWGIDYNYGYRAGIAYRMAQHPPPVAHLSDLAEDASADTAPAAWMRPEQLPQTDWELGYADGKAGRNPRRQHAASYQRGWETGHALYTAAHYVTQPTAIPADIRALVAGEQVGITPDQQARAAAYDAEYDAAHSQEGHDDRNRPWQANVT